MACPYSACNIPGVRACAKLTRPHNAPFQVGLATPDHTPAGRGWQESEIYFDGANDCEYMLTRVARASALTR
jgi:hypothetical protein